MLNSAVNRTSRAARARVRARARHSHGAVAALPATRQAWRIEDKGAIANLKLVNEALGQLPPGHALVAVRAIGLNFADVFSCLGLYSATPAGSFIPGLEFAGDVLAVNDPPLTGAPDDGTAPGNPNEIRTGDRVWGTTRFGAYATLIQLDLRYLRRFPAAWTYEQAAGYPVQTITACYGLFHLGALQPGHTVLVHSAAGGVGLQALQLLGSCGATVLGTVGSAAKLEQLQQVAQNIPGLTAEFVVRGGVAQFEGDLQAFLQRRGKPGFDLVFDSVQGGFFQPGFKLMVPCGRYIVFGAASLTPAPGSSLQRGWKLLLPWNLLAAVKLVVSYLRRPMVDPLQLPGVNKSVMGFNLIWLYNQQQLFQGIVERLDAMDSLQPPVVGRCFDFNQLPVALEFFQSGKSFGKVVVTVPQEGRDSSTS